MSTIPGSRRALIFEASIVDYILSSENLQSMWAACRYNILISVSELASIIDPAISRGFFNKSTCERTTTLCPKETIDAMGNTHTSRKIIRNGFGVIWNPDLRLRQVREESRQRLDVYGELLASSSLVIPVESAYRLLQAHLISPDQFRLSKSLAREVDQARCMLVNEQDNTSFGYKSELMAEISSFCSNIEECLGDVFGKNKEIAGICLANIRRILISASSIPLLAKTRLPVSVNVNTGLVMHCGNYVLDPILVLIWKMSGHKVCDYTHAYAGIGHIAYTQRPELISLPSYKKLMPDTTVGGLHMWKPVVSGKTMIDIDDITEWVSDNRQIIRKAQKTDMRLLFISTGQYSEERDRIEGFLALTRTLVESEYRRLNIRIKTDIRLHPKEISKQELLSQTPIEDDLNEADVIIGEFSTCLLQAEDSGKTTITVASGLHYGVYNSINTFLLSGYDEGDARRAAHHICLYIRSRYFG